MTPANDELESFLVRLETMPLMELRAEWRKRWGSPPHALRSSRLLRHLIAWRLQAAEYGDLTWDDRRRLKSASLPTLQTLKEGSRVAREYLGVVHEVVAERDGFRYRERQYRSLSAIARDHRGALERAALLRPSNRRRPWSAVIGSVAPFTPARARRRG